MRSHASENRAIARLGALVVAAALATPSCGQGKCPSPGGFASDEVVVTFDSSASDLDIASALAQCPYFKDGFAYPRTYITLQLFSDADLYCAINCLTTKNKVVAALPNSGV